MQAGDEGQSPDREGAGAADNPGGDSLKHRLATLWVQGELAAFYGTVSMELAPRVAAHLRSRLGLTVEDAEDCVQEAIEGFIRHQPGDRAKIPNPQAYLWRCAINAAKDMLRERGQEVQARNVIEQGLLTGGKRNQKSVAADTPPAPAPGAEEAAGPIPEESAVSLTESLLEDIEVSSGWAVQVVTIAVSRLRPPLRLVARHILIYGPDYEAIKAAADLGIRAKTYRANKSKAYKDLREIIPAVMQELGIELVRLGLPETGLTEARSFPSDEDEGER